MVVHIRIDAEILMNERDKLYLALNDYLASVQARIVSMSAAFRMVVFTVVPVIEHFREDLMSDRCGLLESCYPLSNRIEGMNMDHKSAAKDALHNYVDSYAMEYGQKHSLTPALRLLLDHFRIAAHDFIEKDRGNVIHLETRFSERRPSL